MTLRSARCKDKDILEERLNYFSSLSVGYLIIKGLSYEEAIRRVWQPKNVGKKEYYVCQAVNKNVIPDFVIVVVVSLF